MIIIGSVILLLLCWKDFRDKVIRPRGAARYFLAFAFFMVVNYSVYYLLIRLVIHKDPAVILMMGNTEKFSVLELFQPILLAVMYFGAGAATYKLGDKVSVNIYQEIINVFQSLFRLPGKMRIWIGDCIEKSQVKIEQLEGTIKHLQQYAMSKGWSGEDDQWKDLELELRMTNEQIDELKDINKRLESLKQDPTISEIIISVGEKIKRWQEKEIAKMKRYLAQFLVTYVKDVSEMERVLEEIGAPRWPGNGRLKFDFIYRSVGMSFLFGIAFGPVFYFRQNSSQPLDYAWCGALSLSAFGLVFSFTNSLKQKSQTGVNTILIGAAAGAIAYIVWRITKNSFIGDVQTFSEYWKESLTGVSYGVVIGLLVFLFKRHVLGIVQNVLLLYVAIACAGAVAFGALSFLPLISQGGAHPLLAGSIGAIVMPAIAFALDIFAPADGKGESAS